MMTKGKPCFNRKPKAQRPPGDLYHTPFSLVWKLLEVEKFKNCLEPACGDYAIMLASCIWLDKDIFGRWFDIRIQEEFQTGGVDFLKYTEKWNGDILTNPPFSLWDEFVTHAKKICTGRICMLGRTNYFGCVGRYNSDIWRGLHYTYVFNRYPDLRTPYREDGLFHVGGHQLAWFIWDPGYNGEHIQRLLDVSEYAKLGQYREGMVA